MREPLQELREDSYERPNQPWLCGLVDAAGSCPLGPGKGGRCPAAAACQPIREGDRWKCNRAPARGGPCDEGPTPDGQCAHIYRCAPIMSLRLKRGRFVVGCLLFTVGVLLVVLSSSWRNEAIVPGELSAHHAQLLNGTSPTERCASCHAAGPQTFSEWLAHITNGDLARPTQTELCLKCHHNRITPVTATWAHNVDPQVLLSSHLGEDQVPPHARAVDPTAPLACSACHREHQGAQHSLTDMSEAACQACHRMHFGSFAADHPAFSAWPATRRTRIAFDHASHSAKHFPAEHREFQCSACHDTDAQGTLQRTLSYESTCAGCHDKRLAASWEAGLPVFALPMLDTDALDKAGHTVGQWPDEASGEFDGPLPAITKLLIATDSQASKGLAVLGPNFDLLDLDASDPAQLAAVGDVVWAVKELLHNVATEGHAAIGKRVSELVGRDITPAELSKLTGHLSAENVSAVSQLWLTRLLPEIASRRGEDFAAVPADAPAAIEQDRATARGKVAAGGWFRDDVTLSIRYRPIGHADPFVTAWFDLLVELANGSRAEIAESLLRQQLAPTAPGLCGSCHTLDRTADGKLAINWLAKRSATPSFTFFSHRAHLTQAGLADCQACHKIEPAANVAATFAGDSPQEFVAGFQPLTRESCAACHMAHAAGEACTLCHRYHAELRDDPARLGH